MRRKKNPPPFSSLSAPRLSAAERALAAKAQRRRRAGYWAIGAVVAVVFSAVWNPPTGKVHSFTNASDYKVDRDSGCTNSGKGCHGTETSYRDFNDYHPNADCTSCHEYQGVGCIPCHSPKNHECQVCHDGTMKGAADTVRLSDPYPRGHYRETTHTAMGTKFDVPVRTSAKGKASATCKSCHARDMMASHASVPAVAGSTYGKDVGCGECHNDVRAFGQAEVLSDWEKRRCEDCHKVGSSSPMHDTSVANAVEADTAAGCSDSGKGCHQSSDLHALHPDAPKDCSGRAAKGEPGCHDLNIQAHVPTATSCGGSGNRSCHRGYGSDGMGHARGSEIHSPEGTVPAGDLSYYATACGDCHWMEPDGVSLVTEHAAPFSARTSDADNCRNCHNDPASAVAIAKAWPGRDGTGACDDCHGANGLDSAHARVLEPLHVAGDSKGCANSGAGCHPTDDLLAVGDPAAGDALHRDCLRCHDKAAAGGNRAYAPGDDSCGSGRDCHAQTGAYDPETGVHDGAGSPTDGTDAAHTASGLKSASMTDATSRVSVKCTACHSATLGVEHGRRNNVMSDSTFTSCVACHNANAATAGTVKRSWPGSKRASACMDCHTNSGAGAVHSGIETVHAGRELDANGVTSAGACTRSGCHSSADLRVVHSASGCTVTGCHSATGDIRGLAMSSCGGNDAERSCHVGYSQLGGHGASASSHTGVELNLTGVAQKSYCARSGCHTSLNLEKLHGADGCADKGCHDGSATVPAISSCGGPASDAACHATFSADEHLVKHSADLTGTVSGVAYGAGQNVGCFGCHPVNLRDAHQQPGGTGVGSGNATSCRVCHHDAQDPGCGTSGGLPAVSGAVASHDLRCVTCHSSGSADANALAAASPHQHISTQTVLPTGTVWADPFAEWKVAFASSGGSGHNALPGALVGGTTRSFPVTQFTLGATAYTWALPANSGTTTWLRTEAFPGVTVDTDAAIRGITVTCADCHSWSKPPAGPHGAAVPVLIDEDYSQTEYANPSSALVSQFDSTGTQRVICMKCHNLLRGSVPGTSAPGGSWVHAQHAEHKGFPAFKQQRWGERCIECHVRIPHAWKHPRLLVRTVDTAEGSGDQFPYISKKHDGLAGILLRDFNAPEELKASDCVTGGCHGRHDQASHPSAEDVPGIEYWP